MYLTKEKFKIQDLVAMTTKPSRVLIISPDVILREIYQKHLEADEFLVALGRYPEVMPTLGELTSYDLLVLEVIKEVFEEQRRWLEDVKNTYPEVKVITVGIGLPEDALTNLMSTGIIGHIDRKLTRPQDLVLLIKTIIQPNSLSL